MFASAGNQLSCGNDLYSLFFCKYSCWTLPLIHYTLHKPPGLIPSCLILWQVKARPSLSQSPTPAIPFLYLQHALLNLQHTVSRIFSSVLGNPRAKVTLGKRGIACAGVILTTAAIPYRLKISRSHSKQSAYHIHLDKLPLSNGLSRVSTFGIDQIVACLAEAERCDISQKDNMSNTPLGWAAKNGHEAVVEILLRRSDIDPNKPDKKGRTPLLWAAYCEHEGVVKLLLGRDDVNPNIPEDCGPTPLLWAACFGYEGVVKIILERDDVDPNKPNNNGLTPLGWAASYGYAAVVKQVLGRSDINPDMPDNDGRTPLWWAASEGYSGVVKLLLGRDDVNPDKPDNQGRAALHVLLEMATCE